MSQRPLRLRLALSLRSSRSVSTPWQNYATPGSLRLYVKDHADDNDVVLKWGAYMMALNEDTNTFVTRFGRMVVSMGTEIDVPDKDSAWQKEQEFIGFVPPADGPERKLYYMLQSVLTGDTDMNELSTAVLALGRVDMEKVRLARESFRNDEGKAATEGPDEETGSMESESDIQ
jgi:hypothetical protein